MWAWLNEILERRADEKERQRQHELDLRVCRSCETLQAELVRAHQREQQLLELIVSKQPEPEQSYQTRVDVKTEIPRAVKPWSVKRQELEARDRVKIEPIKKEITPDTLDEELNEVRKNHASR